MVKTILPGVHGTASPQSLDQQYAEQLVSMVAARKLQEMAHSQRLRAQQQLLQLMLRFQQLPLPEVAEASMAFANAPLGKMTAAYDRLCQALLDCRESAERSGEGHRLTELEGALAKLVTRLSEITREEAKHQGDAMRHKAAAEFALKRKQGGGLH